MKTATEMREYAESRKETVTTKFLEELSIKLDNAISFAADCGKNFTQMKFPYYHQNEKILCEQVFTKFRELGYAVDLRESNAAGSYLYISWEKNAR